MGNLAQPLAIAAASVATFAGVYFMLPAKGSEDAPAPTAANVAATTPSTDDRRKITDPLEPAERGLVECHHPNEQRKTCRSMTRYKALGGGRYSDTTVALVSNDGPMLVEITLPVVMKSAAVCATMSSSAFARGKVLYAGRLINPAEAAPVLKAAAAATKRYMNKEVCTSYVSSFGAVTGKAAIDGVPQPDLDVRLKWVRLDDGYTVGP